MSPSLIWFCIGLACFVAEIFTPTFVICFFGMGALASAIFSLFLHDLPTELAIFAIVSVASLFLLRGRIMSVWGRAQNPSQKDTSPYGQPGQSGQVGRTGTVTKAIPRDGEGEIAMGESFWRAVADEALPEGTAIRVTGHVPGKEILMHVVRLNTHAS